MKAAVQHCAERKGSSDLEVGLVDFGRGMVHLERHFGPGMEPKPPLSLLLNISVWRHLWCRFLFYPPQEPEKTPSTCLVETTNFSKGHHVPLFPKDWWISLHSQCSHGSALYPFAVLLFSGVRLISAMIMALFYPKTPVNTPWWHLIFCNGSKKGPMSSLYSP